jgi:hypothetical protein
MELQESHSGWSEYQQLVLSELKRHNDQLESIDDKITELRGELSKFQIQIAAEVAMLKVKSGLWGGLAGVITVLLALGIKLITGHP